jgi:two-component system response regulator RegA
MSEIAHLRGIGPTPYACAMDRSAILIVDDDADVANAAAIALRDEVTRVATASSLAELEQWLSAYSFDAVLLDMNFAAGRYDGTEGLTGLARIRHADASLAVVLMTAYAGVSIAVESLKRGAVDFLMKPWHNARLIESMRSAMATTLERRVKESLLLDAIEKITVEKALSRHRGNISLAAAALGVSRAALYRRKQKYGL